MNLTGPNFEIESGAVKAWDLTPDTTPELTASAVLRLGQRVLSSVSTSVAEDRYPDSDAYTYATVYQDSALEIVAGVIDVVLPTTGLSGIEYLWQVDLLSAAGDLVQRWRGIIVITASLPAL